MPTKVPTLVLKGLAEGLTLHAAEREGIDAQSLGDRFERLLDHRPHANQIESVLRDVQDAEYVRGSEDEGARFQLTQEGARRLEAYRRLPKPFKRSLVELFRIRPNAIVEEVDPQTQQSGDQSETGSARADGWVQDALDRIPREVEVQAHYARVSMDRDPAARTWTLRVEQHEPGRYEGAQACPLTFLYRAATRLLSEAKGPARTSSPEVQS